MNYYVDDFIRDIEDLEEIHGYREVDPGVREDLLRFRYRARLAEIFQTVINEGKHP